MNVYGKDIIVDAKMGKILLESEIIKQVEYTWLKRLLEDSENHSVKYNQLEDLQESQKDFMLSSLFTNLYTIASNEWEIDGLKEDTQKLECSLCGEKNTVKKYYIKNKINKRTLNVGSTCITNFRNIRGTNGKSKEDIDKEWEKQQRQKVLNDRHNGIMEKIEKWNQKLDEIPTIISKDLEDKYDNIYSKIQQEYKKFLKAKKVDYLIADEIHKLVCEGEALLIQIYGDINSKKDNEWYITKEIKDWCLKNRQENQTVIDFLRKDGLVTWKSACRIYEKNFVNKVLEKLKVILANSNMQLVNYNEKNNSFIININDHNPYTSRIDLYCPYNSFMAEFGNKIFENNTSYTDGKNFCIKNSKILDDSSIEISISHMKFLLSKTTNKIYEWNLNYNELVFFKDNHNYTIVDLKTFVNIYKNCIFTNQLEDTQVKSITDYIAKYGGSIRKQEYKDMLETREKLDKATQVNYSNFV